MIGIQKNIKLLRKAVGLTQRELANLLDVTTKTVERYETVMPPRGRVLLKLAEVAAGKGRPDLALPFQEAHQAEFDEMRQQMLSEAKANWSLVANAVESATADHQLRESVWEAAEEMREYVKAREYEKCMSKLDELQNMLAVNGAEEPNALP